MKVRTIMLVCMALFLGSSLPLQAQSFRQARPTKDKWYQKVLKPIRHPLSWWRKPKSAEVRQAKDNSSSPARNPARVNGQPRNRDQINKQQIDAGLRPVRTNRPNRQPVMQAGTGENQVDSFSGAQNMTNTEFQTPASQPWVGKQHDKPPYQNPFASPSVTQQSTQRQSPLRGVARSQKITGSRISENTLNDHRKLDKILRSGTRDPHSFNEFLQQQRSTRPPVDTAKRLRSQIGSQDQTTLGSRSFQNR